MNASCDVSRQSRVLCTSPLSLVWVKIILVCVFLLVQYGALFFSLLHYQDAFYSVLFILPVDTRNTPCSANLRRVLRSRIWTRYKKTIVGRVNYGLE